MEGISALNPKSVGPTIQINSDDVIETFENGSYFSEQNMEFIKADVHETMAHFYTWFSSVARLYYLNCDRNDCEAYIYQLIALRKQIKFALKNLRNRRSGKYRALKLFDCVTCSTNTLVNSRSQGGFWQSLQNHPDFEENYIQALEAPKIEKAAAGLSLDTNSAKSEEQPEEATSCKIKEQAASTCQEVATKDVTNNLNSFKFNFVIKYEQIIEDAFYPKSLIDELQDIDKISVFTLQRWSEGSGCCLLCKVNFHFTFTEVHGFDLGSPVLRSHVNSVAHKQNLLDLAQRAELREYHDFWKRQDVFVQAHQVYFGEGDDKQSLKCRLCESACMRYSDVVDHCRGREHRACFDSFIGGNRDMTLLLVDLQAKVFGEELNLAEKRQWGNSSRDGLRNANNGRVEARPNWRQPVKKCVPVPAEADEKHFWIAKRYADQRRYFQLKPNNEVFCQICKLYLELERRTIIEHIFGDYHRALSTFALPRYSFFCEICIFSTDNEAAWDDHFVKGPNKHESVAEVRKENLQEYECQTCNLVIYGDQMSLRRHVRPHPGLSKKKETVLPASVKTLFKNKTKIKEQAYELLNAAVKVAGNFAKMAATCELLCNVVSEIYADCRAYPFGSRVSGLGTENSDLDIFLDVDEMYSGDKNQDSLTQKQFVNKIGNLLDKKKCGIRTIRRIASARTPIIRIKHVEFNLECDVSFRHGLGNENTKLLKFCMSLQPILQSLILLLKKWSVCCGVNEDINNYGLALLALFYLQQEGYHISVAAMRSFHPEPGLEIDGWETIHPAIYENQAAVKASVRPYTFPIYQLLRDFFKFYSNFDYANDIVCPLLGQVVKKFTINEDLDVLPEAMEAYVSRIKEDRGERFRGLSPFCIQDPFDLSHNLTKGCAHDAITRFKALCGLTFLHLDTIINK